MLTADNTRLHKETNRSRNYGGKRKNIYYVKKKRNTSFQLCGCQMLQELHFAVYSFDPPVIPEGKCLIYCKDGKTDEERAAVGTAPVLHVQDTLCIHVQRVRLVQEICCYKLRFL